MKFKESKLNQESQKSKFNKDNIKSDSKAKNKETKLNKEYEAEESKLEVEHKISDLS